MACAAVVLQKAGKKKLTKKELIFAIRDESGYMPYEPTLVATDADLLCQRLIDAEGTHHNVEVVKTDLLTRVACGD